MSASADEGAAPDGAVNPHYLNHVVATAATRQVQTSEDVYSAQGIKLLAKGATIDASTRDRLLAHKLSKPLEDCVQVVDGVVPELFGPLAEKLQEKLRCCAPCAPTRARSRWRRPCPACG